MLGQAIQRTTSNALHQKHRQTTQYRKARPHLASEQVLCSDMRFKTVTRMRGASLLPTRDSNHLVSGRSRAEHEDLQYWRVLHLGRNVYNSATNRQRHFTKQRNGPSYPGLDDPGAMHRHGFHRFRHVSMAAGRMREGESARMPQ